jgi:protein-tyrosine phosphatase
MKKIVFVCTANVCRSPTAEHYMRHVAQRLGLEDAFSITSVGVMGLEGREADPVAAQLLADRGISMEGHRSRGVDRDEMIEADRIVVMERRHRAWFRDNLPEVLDKVSLLRESLDGAHDIRDPIGQSLARYRECLGQLFEAVERLTIDLRYE